MRIESVLPTTSSGYSRCYGTYLDVFTVGRLVAQAGDGGLVCGDDLGGGAGVPQVVVVEFPLGGAHHQPRAVWSEVYGRQWRFHPDAAQNAKGENNTRFVLPVSNGIQKENAAWPSPQQPVFFAGWA